MKKIFALLVSFVIVATGFAQTGTQKEEAKRIILGERKGSASNPFPGDDRTVYGERGNRYPERYPNVSVSTRERQMYEINRAYNAKIYSIRNNRTLSRSEKERIIRQLESDRHRAIAQIDGRYYGNNDRSYEDYGDYKKSKGHKGNNGNHYGRYKGKSNPHK